MLICPNKTETVLCYLLYPNPSLLKPMTTTNHRVVFFTILLFLSWLLFPHSMLLIPPAAFISSFNRGKSAVDSCSPLPCYLVLWGDTQGYSLPAPRRGAQMWHSQEGLRSVQQKKSVLAPVWNMLSTDRIS